MHNTTVMVRADETLCSLGLLDLLLERLDLLGRLLQPRVGLLIPLQQHSACNEGNRSQCEYQRADGTRGYKGCSTTNYEGRQHRIVKGSRRARKQVG